MKDLYNIPNDDGKEYRLKKFVEYQHEVPSIHYRYLGEWIKRKKYEANKAINLSWLLAITYNEITTILVDELLKKKSFKEIWEENKGQLQFGSAKKYAKNNDQFLGLIKDFSIETGGSPISWLNNCQRGDGQQTYREIQKNLLGIKNCGRFSSDLFLETIIYLKDYLKINVEEPTSIDWKNCANLTSGIFNIFYEDEKANEYDKTKKLSKQDELYLTGKLEEIQKRIIETYPEQDAEISLFIGKICSFRNLFKNARYGGFHHDRQLGVIKFYEKEFPQYDYLWEECYELRKSMFDERFLGELHNWEGIRKERKKLWLKTGKTGAEPTALKTKSS